MNDRIREIAEHAGITPGVMGLNRFTHFDPEKFGELIVRECAKVARKKTLRSTGVSEEFTGTVYIEDEIRNHFGVK